MEFNQPYNRDKYLDFLSDKFKKFDRLFHDITIDNNDVNKFKQLGSITTADNKNLPVFEIYIKPTTQLARNRVQLRNLVAKQIQSEDGALAVYIDEKNKQWRFSFIAIEYKFDDDGITRTQTASKRYTYLLGENAQTRTAEQRFGLLNKESYLSNLENAFAVEPLNKEFYDKLYKWYINAQKKVTFPNDGNDENHKQTSLIRLLTRLLFIWFLKEKKLINLDLFDDTKLQDIIDYNKDSSFYKAILQNLFFATLSTEIVNRKFASEERGHKGYNPDFNNQYVFRHQELFKTPDKIEQYFNNIPFLNGGLFECLDDKENGIYIDGFSRTKKHQPTMPNELFFNEDESGLIDLFNQYQFTIEESTPQDIEVALDPELLGKVFENLLATYNPETGEQARKATGSFYTPREIVSYMVDESLKQYFKTHTNLDNKQINDLFIESKNILSKNEIMAIINAINNLKILDPAVGSGAYPMGILQRLIFILDKIDKKAEYFKTQQLKNIPSLSSIEKDLKTAEKINDKQAKQKAKNELEFRKQEIEEKFKNQDHIYLRKLYLIENCIYGVDIQAIAIQICQLRFFISLAIEQEKDEQDENFGIQPLPNLDYHFEVGNSLIGFPKNYSTDSLKNLLTEIKPLKHRFFSENNHQEKDKLRKKIDGKIKECYQNTEKSIGYLVNFDFKIDFSEIFDEQDGFDIVIGNPPYIRQESIKEFKPKFKEHYPEVFAGTADIYTYFYAKGFNLLSKNGHLCYITSNKWMRAKYGENLRYFFKNQTQIKQIIDFEGEQIFANATVDTNIILVGKTPNTQTEFDYQKRLPNEANQFFTMPIADLSENAYTLQPPEILALKKKIEAIGTPLKKWKISINYGIKTGLNEAFIINTEKKDELIAQDPKSAEIIRPILRGRDIKAYEANWAGLWVIATFPALKINIDDYPAVKKYLQSFGEKIEQSGNKGCRKKTNNKWFETQDSIAYWNDFSKQKIVYSEIVQKPQFYFDDKNYFAEATSFIMSGKHLKFLIALLHSKLITYAFKVFYAGGGLGEKGYRYKKVFIEQLPIPKISTKEQQPFIVLVDEILKKKTAQQDTQYLENEINQLVYNLYQLTPAEKILIEQALTSQ